MHNRLHARWPNKGGSSEPCVRACDAVLCVVDRHEESNRMISIFLDPCLVLGSKEFFSMCLSLTTLLAISPDFPTFCGRTD